MSIDISSFLTVEPIDLPVPILKHHAWVDVTYPKGIAEDKLITELGKYLEAIKHYAKTNSIAQIKITTDNLSWKSLTTLGFHRGTYYLTVNPQAITHKNIGSIQVVPITDFSTIRNLIIHQFEFHKNSNPYYFTNDVETSADWFISLAHKRIQDDSCICYGAEKDNRMIGFIYVELDDNEACMDELFVSGSERKKGLGSALIHEACNRIVQRMIPLVSTFTGVNMKSISLYKQLGFEIQSVNWVLNID